MVGRLQRSLGDYRFSRVVREELDGAYVYEFSHASDAQKRVFAAWQPRHGTSVITLAIPRASVVKAELMPLNEAPAGTVAVEAAGAETRVPVSDSPTFIRVE